MNMEPLLPFELRVSDLGSRQRLRSLHGQLRTAILKGRLCAGAKLPSTRSLALALAIGRNTVVSAYDMLISEGYLRAARGSGTYVATLNPGLAPQRESARHRLARDLLPRAWRTARPRALDQRRVRFDFRIGIPDLDRFPRSIWCRLLGRSQRRGARVEDLYAAPAGVERLRFAIARHISNTRAIACGPADLIVTAGAQHAFDLIARILVVPGRTVVALEDPGYAPLAAVFRAAGAHLVAVPVDEHGMVTKRVPPGAHVICVTPSHQFPLGGVLPIDRRLALLEYARRNGAVIIEDDYDSEFRFGDRPLDALQTLDQCESVFYVGSFSKILSPDLRTGFTIAPPWARDPLLSALQVNVWNCPSVYQQALADFILEGHLARHLRRVGREYSLRRKLLLDGLRTELSPWFTPIESSAGLHIAARVADGYAPEALVAKARRCGVAIENVADVAQWGSRKRAVRVVLFGYGCISQQDIAAAIGTLRNGLRQIHGN